MLKDIFFFARHDARKGTALHNGVGSLMVFQVTAELPRMPIEPAVEYSYCPWLFVQHCCIFVLFFIAAAGLATKCSVKEILWSRNGDLAEDCRTRKVFVDQIRGRSRWKDREVNNDK